VYEAYDRKVEKALAKGDTVAAFRAFDEESSAGEERPELLQRRPLD